MDENTEKAEKKLTYAKELLCRGGQWNTDIACAILIALVRQKRMISIRQSTDAAVLLSSFLKEKNKELDKNIEKMRQSLEGRDIPCAVEALHYLAENNGYLSEEQNTELLPIKAKFFETVKIVAIGNIYRIKRKNIKEDEKVKNAESARGMEE